MLDALHALLGIDQTLLELVSDFAAGSSMATSIAIRQKLTGLFTSCSRPAASVPMAAIFSCWSIWPLMSTRFG
jgi:hypothetical protein